MSPAYQNPITQYYYTLAFRLYTFDKNTNMFKTHWNKLILKIGLVLLFEFYRK